MDPHRTTNAQLQSILHALNTTPRIAPEADDMPAPPAYHTVVDTNIPLPNMRNPYDPEEENDDEDTPEITINAATQVRGHGNIISIAQMDSIRIANLIAVMLKGESQDATTLPSLASMTKPTRPYPKINITVNCGATVIGDRNIVGPGLGDIARQMQVAQRNQAAQQQTARTASMALGVETIGLAQTSMAQRHGVFATQTVTPPMSRSGSLQSDASGGGKRKAEDDVGEGVSKRRC